MPESNKPTIVLVHGAWADASGWNAVIGPLHAEGFTVAAIRGAADSISRVRSATA